MDHIEDEHMTTTTHARGPRKTEEAMQKTATKRPKQPNGGTLNSHRDRERTDSKVLRAVKEHGEVTLAELARATGLSDSTIWLSTGRLTAAGKIREVEGMKRRVPRGNLARLYELGDGRNRKQSATVIEPIRRHWQDAALFGEYARAA